MRGGSKAVGVLLVATLGLFHLGCGSVSGKTDAGTGGSGPTGGESGSAGTNGAAGASSVGGTAGRGTTGTGGNAGTAGTADSGAAGAAGSPGRANGAGCTDNSQCASSVCVKASSTATSGMCCDKANDPCNTCVGGYSTPVQDGTTCGDASCDSTKKISTVNTCKSGTCIVTTTNCVQQFCFYSFASPGSENQLACAASASSYCLGYAGGSNDLGCGCGASTVGDTSCP
jgi:hypothetical protein